MKPNYCLVAGFFFFFFFFLILVIAKIQESFILQFLLLTATPLPPRSPLVTTQATPTSALMSSCSTAADGVDPSPIGHLGEKIKFTCMFESRWVYGWSKETL